MQRDDRGGALLGGRRLDEILRVAGVDTPAYVYDLGAIAAEARALRDGFGGAPHLCAYAVKANAAGAVVRALAAAGCGAEVGSRAELEVALGAGMAADAILCTGAGKTERDIDAAIGAGVLALQVDDVGEIARVAARARALGRRARLALRVNPAVAADTHAYIATGHDEAKFGIALADLPAAWSAIAQAGACVELVGLGAHIGSQLERTTEYLEAARVVLSLARAQEAASGERFRYVDLGGGFGIDYGAGCEARPADFARGAVQLARELGMAGRTLVVEPGRALVGAHGVLCARVVTAKRSGGRRWLVVDAGMNDLLRPALYGARHRVEPLDRAPDPGAPRWHVAGPVCESADEFGAWPFAEPLPTEVVIRDAGAYGFTMASQYNGRALPAEVFVHEDGRVTASTAGDAVSWVAARLAT
jgi:diaminopimelate decarboxylase